MACTKTLLWEILVPTTHQNGTVIDVQHHKIWDEKVRKVAGGLTIFHPAKGNWISPDGELFAEKMIPVRVACVRAHIQAIADMTAEHYQQEAVMYNLVSADVVIKHYNGTTADNH